MKSLKSLLLLGVAVGLFISAAVAEELPLIRIGDGGGLCEGPIHIGIEKGFFTAEGLRVETFKLAPGTAFEAIAAGKIDATNGLLATLLAPLVHGLPIKITTGLHTGCNKVLVPANSPIKTAADFRGKKVGVPSLVSSPITFAKRVLAASGVGVSATNMEVEFIVYSEAELPLALERGAIDAIAGGDPIAAIAAKKNNLTVLFDSATLPPYNEQYCCAAYVSNALYEKSPEVAAKFTRAMQQASLWIQSHQDETAAIQVEKKYVPGDAELNAAVLKTYNFIPSAQGAYTAFAALTQELRAIGVIAEDFDVEHLKSTSFAFDLPGGVLDPITER
ncbi:MAG: ABC transporter substrate-binding protein [Planctomycetota bacterium]|jgi:NitT/TauT family transport system substrate-binding protein|nr:ABC transporter substrate-binding protein [Planctomycetota bacterium]